MNRLHSILVLSLMAAAGCGGGNGPAFPTTTNARVTIAWAARSRTLSAPSSALSALMTIGAGAADASDASFTVNRNADPAAYTQTYSSPNPVRIGTFPFHARFFALADGAGDLVGTADAQVTIAQDGTGVGDISVVGTVASVSVTSDLTLKVGEKAPPQVEVRDARGNLLAVSPGSVFLSAVSGTGSVKIDADGQVEGVTAGDAAITATVDAHASAEKPVHVLLRRYVVTDLGTLGGDYIQTSRMNNSGQVVGTASLANGDPHAFLWTPNQPNGTSGQMTDIGTLPGHKTSLGTDVNERGDAVGTSYPATGYSGRAFLWRNGSLQEIHGPPTSTYSGAIGISDAGKALIQSNGYMYLWDNGVLTGIGGGGSGVYTWATAMSGSGDYVGNTQIGPGGHSPVFGWAVINGNRYSVMENPGAINDIGQVIGYNQPTTYDPRRAYLWTVSGGSTILRGPAAAPDDLQVRALNNLTQIVGLSDNKGVVLENGVAYELAPMLPPGHQWLIAPNAINDRGQIAGVGSADGGPGRALLLTPEP